MSWDISVETMQFHEHRRIRGYTVSTAASVLQCHAQRHHYMHWCPRCRGPSLVRQRQPECAAQGICPHLPGGLLTPAVLSPANYKANTDLWGEGLSGEVLQRDSHPRPKHHLSVALLTSLGFKQAGPYFHHWALWTSLEPRQSYSHSPSLQDRNVDTTCSPRFSLYLPNANTEEDTSHCHCLHLQQKNCICRRDKVAFSFGFRQVHFLPLVLGWK